MAQRRERYTGKKEGRREKIIDDMIGNNKKNRRKNEAEMRDRESGCMVILI